jgi:hypothetical protein
MRAIWGASFVRPDPLVSSFERFAGRVRELGTESFHRGVSQALIIAMSH